MLPKELFDLMRELSIFPAVLATVDAGGDMHQTFITWLYPIEQNLIRMALSSNSKSAQNMIQTQKASLFFFAPNTAIACYGSVRLVKERIESVKFPVNVFEMEVQKVENCLFPGGTVLGVVPFMHTGNLQKAAELDSLVLEALKG
ncbi:pyridoxamine 5'-phosphate oxidase family protein [Thermocrinis minervae]|uniref:Pyridoxamine 5'-phosphate oxidase n=1 Tax=Thermocrinis minervae TaxID=381751 RepID=A0A1M6R1B6_9AQUI|nr:pyridoxamine 5'-phosphate oxidase family protein [Thermocrinis minervae]SHK26213.1 Pyridoxamine 5'-phosphate oxidase [Thermocrinis minervae]